VKVADPGGVAITLVLLHGSANIADATMKTNHRVLRGFSGMGTGPAAQEVVSPNLTVEWQILLDRLVPDVFGEGTTAVRASAEISDDELGRLSDGKKLESMGDVGVG
jgi:hypothetical protein